MTAQLAIYWSMIVAFVHVFIVEHQTFPTRLIRTDIAFQSSVQQANHMLTTRLKNRVDELLLAPIIT